MPCWFNSALENLKLTGYEAKRRPEAAFQEAICNQ